MKLQPALIFGQNMILQRGIPIPVWGRSVRDDTVTVVLNGYTLHTQAKRGEWRVTFQPMERSHPPPQGKESNLEVLPSVKCG